MKTGVRFRVAAASCVVCAIALLLSAAPAFAGAVTGATITQVLASGTNGFFIYVNIPPSGEPSCATSTVSSYRFVVNLSQPGGASIVATALSAHATGSEVDIAGTGACDVWSDTETINYLTGH